MDTQINKDSIDRDTKILKIVGGNMNNLKLLKEIVDELTTRVEKLEKNKLDKPKEGYVVKTEKVELFDE
jgi:chaperonin cofactor prefoldin|tara:strand:- start:625 stop:831 length:207 start_codon:yes stop_codon:yes gene_type:complete